MKKVIFLLLCLPAVAFSKDQFRLEPSVPKIDLEHFGETQEISVTLYKNGEKVKWVSKDAQKISQTLAVTDSGGFSYSYKNLESPVTFSPVGASWDGYEYSFVISANAGISSQNRNLRIHISSELLSEPAVIDVLLPDEIVKPNFDQLLRKLENIENQMPSVMVGLHNTYLVAILGIIIGFVGSLWFRFKDKESTNTVVASESSETRKQVAKDIKSVTKSHRKLFEASREIKTDTGELRKFTDKIDTQIAGGAALF